jgi:hypothetical protein
MLPLVPDHMRGAASVEQDHPVPLGKVVAGDAIQVAAVPCDARPLLFGIWRAQHESAGFGDERGGRSAARPRAPT